MGKIIESTSVRIPEMIDYIESGSTQLPDFQRDFKWSKSKIKSLIDSIQKEYPVGNLLYLSVDRDNPILQGRAFKYADKGKFSKNVPENLVLDGQQRMTSCYVVFANKGNYTYYIDYTKLMSQFKDNKKETDFESVIVCKPHNQTPQDMISKGLFPLCLFRNKELFNTALGVYVDSVKNDESKNEICSFLNTDFRTITASFLDYEIPITKITCNMNLGAVCKIFSKINTSALKLSAFDICVAVFMPGNINLRTKIEEANSKYGYIREILTNNQTDILQTIALLADKNPKEYTLAEVLKIEDIIKYWDDAVSGMNQAMEMLDDFGAGTRKSIELVPYIAVIPVIAALLIKLNYNSLDPKTSASVKNKLRRYFFTTALNLRYTEGVNNKIREDFKSMFAWLSGQGDIPSIITKEVDWNTDTYIHAKKGKAFGNSILCVLNYQQPKDFFSNSKVGIGENIEPCDLHHIFPKATYRKIYGDLTESVFNRTWLTKTTNDHINNSKTCDYLSHIDEYGETEEALKDKLENHLIDSKLFGYMKDENYVAFLKARAEKFKDILSSFGVLFRDVSPNTIDLDDTDSEEEVD